MEGRLEPSFAGPPTKWGSGSARKDRSSSREGGFSSIEGFAYGHCGGKQVPAAIEVEKCRFSVRVPMGMQRPIAVYAVRDL